MNSERKKKRAVSEICGGERAACYFLFCFLFCLLYAFDVERLSASKRAL